MKRKILSIDGGGIKGVFAAQILSDVEEEYGIKLCDYFDIITGTSTGAIIASGLALGIAAKDILNLYLEKGKYIFDGYSEKVTKRLIGLIKMGVSSKYRNENLKKCLMEVFEEKRIGDCKTRLLIPTYNLHTGRVEIFKTAHHEAYIRDYKERFVDVLLSTTAAPTYLPAYVFNNRGRYIDGGVGANNPSYIAVVEALTSCKWNAEDIYVLSIGCTDDYEKFSNDKKVNGMHVLDIIGFFMRAENQYSENISKLLLNNEPERYVRINVNVSKNECALDNVTKQAMQCLIRYAKDESKKHAIEVSNTFIDKPKEKFVPKNRI